MTENATGSSLRQIDPTTRSSSLKRVGISDSSYGAFILDMGDLEQQVWRTGTIGMGDLGQQVWRIGTVGMGDLDSRHGAFILDMGDLGQQKWRI